MGYLASSAIVEKWICGLITIIFLNIYVVVAIEPRLNGNPCDSEPIWAYTCTNDQCTRVLFDNKTRLTAISLNRCRQFCGLGQPVDFWPKPSAKGSISANTESPKWIPVHSDLISFIQPLFDIPNSINFFDNMEQRFMKQLKNKLPKLCDEANDENVQPLKILFDVENRNSKDLKLKMDVDESYEIIHNESLNEIIISARNIFGIRHGLETVVQIIVYDDVTNQLLFRNGVAIKDVPVYSHRGISLDTARNYYSVGAIKKMIDAMAMVKLNVFHWHLTDTQSFPMTIKSHEYLSKYGSYTKDEIYTADDIRDVVQYAYYRGIRVIPEFDAPAHVGEGWQFTDLMICLDLPWTEYCVEPPCGQFDPSQDKLYDVLEDIYREMFDMFDEPEAFHMGGDEVSVTCWNSSERIQNWMKDQGWGLENVDFMKLWNHFQVEALKRYDKVSGGNSKIFMWTSGLTELPYLTEYLDKDRYIIQVWTTGYEPQVTELLQSGYKVIISNYDALYLDCGYESYVGLGNNWCSPYSGWHYIYRNYINWGDQYAHLILGGEAALWSEQADDQSLDGRIWPRSIALAEWLWTSPESSYRDAEPRILMQRERFVENGIRAEVLQPRWCLLNQGKCPDKSPF